MLEFGARLDGEGAIAEELLAAAVVEVVVVVVVLVLAVVVAAVSTVEVAFADGLVVDVGRAEGETVTAPLLAALDMLAAATGMRVERPLAATDAAAAPRLFAADSRLAEADMDGGDLAIGPGGIGRSLAGLT